MRTQNQRKRKRSALTAVSMNPNVSVLCLSAMSKELITQDGERIDDEKNISINGRKGGL